MEDIPSKYYIGDIIKVCKKTEVRDGQHFLVEGVRTQREYNTFYNKMLDIMFYDVRWLETNETASYTFDHLDRSDALVRVA